jgi:SAM-dependent methyltransferase
MRTFSVLKRSLSERGVRRTFGRGLALLSEHILGKCYDIVHGVDTSGQVPFGELKLGVTVAVAGRGYGATSPQFLRAAIRSLKISCREFTFVDLGSGKGRMLLVASEFEFKRIIGVDIASDLNLIARNNIGSCLGLGTTRSSIEVMCEDAGIFQFPEDPLVIFMFNPFPAAVLSHVMHNLETSIRHAPRETFVIYRKPLCAEVIESSRLFLPVTTRKSWLTPDNSLAIYRTTRGMNPAACPRAFDRVTS